MLKHTASGAVLAPAPSFLSPLPVFFVLLWSSGFIVAKFGLPYAPPLTFLLLRFAGVLLFLLPAVLLLKAPWPRGQVGHIALAGLLVQAGYLCGVWCAIKLGMPAGLSVRPRQWLGLMFGIAGVGLVVAAKIHLAGLSVQAIALCVLALLSITTGTLYQKRYCPHFDLRTGTVIQFAASIALVLPLAVVLEGLRPDFAMVLWTPHFIIALLWSILALSIGAIFVLFALIRRSDATQVTSLLYLTPPTTAVMAWLMFGEVFNVLGIVGMALAVTGVIFVVKKNR